MTPDQEQIRNTSYAFLCDELPLAVDLFFVSNCKVQDLYFLGGETILP